MLKAGYSPAVISYNVAKEVRAGKGQAQAVAIAYERAREWFQVSHPGKKLPFYLKKK